MCEKQSYIVVVGSGNSSNLNLSFPCCTQFKLVIYFYIFVSFLRLASSHITSASMKSIHLQHRLSGYVLQFFILSLFTFDSISTCIMTKYDISVSIIVGCTCTTRASLGRESTH